MMRSPDRDLAGLPLVGGFGRRSRKTVFCIYCGRRADTVDHVPPRVLLENPYPPNLRTVPACQPCNSGWSSDEEYVATLLGLVGEAPRLKAKTEEGGKVDRALVGSPRLDDRMIRSMSVDVEARVAISPEIARVALVLQKIAMGLHALRYGRGPSLNAFACIAVAGPSTPFPPVINDAQPGALNLKPKRWTTVQIDVFSFVFMKDLTGAAPLWCVVNLHGTLTAIVRCPAPILRKHHRLESAPW